MYLFFEVVFEMKSSNVIRDRWAEVIANPGANLIYSTRSRGLIDTRFRRCCSAVEVGGGGVHHRLGRTVPGAI